jgi:MoxR-like ATPase
MSDNNEVQAGGSAPSGQSTGGQSTGGQGAAPATVYERAHIALQRLREEIGRAVVGQTGLVDEVLTALLAGGHVLIEGVPGIGKTLLVRALAKAFDGKFARIQFTPDLMPADVTGHVLFDQARQTFVTRRGPVFTNLLLADEINRAPAKTQAALLEVMQELQVTIEGEPQPLEPPFMVLATQNPIEQEGTYALPEAQLDRFLLKIRVDYPGEDDERRMVKQVTRGATGDRLNVDSVSTILQPATLTALQALAAAVRVDDAVVDYVVRIVRATRNWPGLAAGAGPRGGIALVRAARGAALMEGRDHVTPDDVKRLAAPALRHRILLMPEMEIEGRNPEELLARLLDEVQAPRS